MPLDLIALLPPPSLLLLLLPLLLLLVVATAPLVMLLPCPRQSLPAKPQQVAKAQLRQLLSDCVAMGCVYDVIFRR